MKIAVFNPCGGVSGKGTLILGALIDNGLDTEKLVKGLNVLPLSGWSIRAEKVIRGVCRAPM